MRIAQALLIDHYLRWAKINDHAFKIGNEILEFRAEDAMERIRRRMTAQSQSAVHQLEYDE